MKNSRLLNDTFRSLGLIPIIWFFVIYAQGRHIGVIIALSLQLFGIPDNVCAWLGLLFFPFMIILIASIVMLKSYKPWILSIPIQSIVYGIGWCITYENFHFVNCAKIVGLILGVQGIAIVGKSLIRYFHLKKKRFE